MLTPGGTLYLIDEHPLAWHFLCPEARPSYFCTEPQRHEREGDYCDRTFRHEHPVVEYQHTVAELVNSVIDAGLRVGRLEGVRLRVLPGVRGLGADGRRVPAAGRGPYDLPADALA